MSLRAKRDLRGQPTRRHSYSFAIGNNMKRMLIWLTVMVSTGPVLLAQERVPAEIENPAITQIGKLPPRGNAWPHPDTESAKSARYGESPWVKSLNGRWKFHWSPRPEAAAAEVLRTAFRNARLG